MILFLTKLYQVVQSCPPIAANTTLGICVIPSVALYCSTHMRCAMDRGVSCCNTHHTAIVTLKSTRNGFFIHTMQCELEV